MIFKKPIALALVLALINEFSHSNLSNKLGFSNTNHFKVKQTFEQDDFKHILLFLYETTQSLIETLIQSKILSIKSLGTKEKEIILHLFGLYDQAFSWEFTSSKHVLKNVIGDFSQSIIKLTATNLEPTPEFSDFFFNPNLVSILFKCYLLVRDDSEICHAAIQ